MKKNKGGKGPNLKGHQEKGLRTQKKKGKKKTEKRKIRDQIKPKELRW